jgi:ferric-dicitrate binding protein FerR (iron transport regulator)
MPRALVAVTQGEVQVSAGSWQGALHEGEAILADSAGHHDALGADVVRGSVAWTSGAVLFANEPLINAVERLERWTGLSIEMDPSLGERPLSVTLEAESPERAVQHVAEALGVRATRRAAGWVLTRR